MSSSGPATLQALLDDFGRSWDGNSLSRAVKALPGPDDPKRAEMLLALVGRDMAERWKRGRRATVEEYLKALPELASSGALMGLIEAEDRL